MFEESLVESTSLLREHHRWPAVISVAVQAAIVVALIVFPVLHPEILPTSAPRIALTAPVFRSALKPPPMQRVHVVTASRSAAVAPAMQAPRIAATGFRRDGPNVDQPAVAVGVNLAGSVQSPLSVLSSLGPAGPHVVAKSAEGGSTAGPIHISTGVMEGRLLEPIQPQYPAIAKLSHTEGTVVVQAIISRSGRIESTQVVSGPAMLQAAALQAVRDARYRPFLLNSQPTEVETTITILFRLGS